MKKLLFPSLMVALTTSSLAGAQTWQSIRVHLESNYYSQFGHRVVSIGDLDSDGVPDYAVAAPREVVASLGELGRVAIYSGADGQLIREHFGTTHDGQFGYTLAEFDDVDGDLVADYAISEQDALDTSGNYAGEVVLFSGASGSVIRQWSRTSNYRIGFGTAVIQVPDLDGDLLPDIAISSPYENTPTRQGMGYVRIYSTADGSELAAVEGRGPLYNQNFGTVLNVPGDVNGDGFDDLLVQSRNYSGLLNAGVHLISGRTFTGLMTMQTPEPPAGFFSTFGAAMGSVGDRNGDGKLEIAISDSFADAPNMPGAGAVWIFDGATGAVLDTTYGEDESEGFGQTMAQLGDVDGDGHNDFAVSQPQLLPFIGNGAIRVISGADGTPLGSIGGPFAHAKFGWSIADAGDIDSDGRADILVGAPGAGGSFGGPPSAQIWSLKP